jgi:(p)ppGpp synthase/HD superfamily hydrolase
MSGSNAGKGMSSVERAVELATRRHAGQLDKAGQPYLLHLLRVMQQVEGDIAKQAAVLHDVLEDTPATADELLEAANAWRGGQLRGVCGAGCGGSASASDQDGRPE